MMTQVALWIKPQSAAPFVARLGQSAIAEDILGLWCVAYELWLTWLVDRFYR